MITNNGLGIHTEKELPERREADFYPTDARTVRSVLQRLAWHRAAAGWEDPWEMLDPGAGSGVWGQEAVKRWPNLYVAGIELREEPKPAGYMDWVHGDFLKVGELLTDRYDLVVGNPPYKLTEKFVRTGLGLLKPGGYLVYLLRLAFLEGQGRRDGLFTRTPPQCCWVCSKRPSFTPDGKTNATAFAAFVWQSGWSGQTTIDWLQTTR